jgi:Xaa-Pro aminopeptidase
LPNRTRQPGSALTARLSACQRKIQDFGVDGYLLTSRSDQYYLTHFDGEDGGALVLPHQVWLITDGRFKHEAAEHAPWAKALVRSGSLIEAIARLSKKYRLTRLGFQPEAMTVEMHTKLRKAVKPTQLVPLPPLIRQLRLYKDKTEVAALERAVHIAQEAFRKVTRRIKLGMTESDLAADLQREMLRLGATSASFPIIIAEGENAAFPHAVPGKRKIRAGSAVLIDWGATVDHYRSDLTRVVFIRRIPPRIGRLYTHVLAAQEAAIAALAPGKRMCDVDAVARKLLKRARLDRAFSHGLGHGLGLDIHEAPRLSKKIKDRLEPGMVVTVEPGVYLPRIGGVRIEDDVLVTTGGCRVLTSLPKALDAMVL